MSTIYGESLHAACYNVFHFVCWLTCEALGLILSCRRAKVIQDVSDNCISRLCRNSSVACAQNTWNVMTLHFQWEEQQSKDALARSVTCCQRRPNCGRLVRTKQKEWVEISVTRLYLWGSFGAFGFIRSYLPRTGNMHNKLSFLGAWGEKKVVWTFFCCLYNILMGLAIFLKLCFKHVAWKCDTCFIPLVFPHASWSFANMLVFEQ